MQPQSKLFIQLNSRLAQTNVRDVGIIETAVIGQSNTGTAFFPFTSLNFINPGSGRFTDCPSAALNGLTYSIFFNENGRFLDESEFSILIGGGFSILIPNFDASQADYHFYVSTVSGVTYNLSTEPITLVEAKDQLRVDFPDDDAIITRMITQCRRAIENYCAVSLVSKQITCTVDLITGVELPYGPVVGSIVSFVDKDGNVIDPTFYKVSGTSFKRITPIDFNFWDATLVYNVGYPIVDEDLKLAILNELAFRYENRGEATQARNNVNPGVCLDAITLADPYKREAWR